MIDGQRDMGDCLLSDQELDDALDRHWRAIMRRDNQSQSVRDAIALRYVALVTEREIRRAEAELVEKMHPAAPTPPSAPRCR